MHFDSFAAQRACALVSLLTVASAALAQESIHADDHGHILVCSEDTRTDCYRGPQQHCRDGELISTTAEPIAVCLRQPIDGERAKPPLCISELTSTSDLRLWATRARNQTHNCDAAANRVIELVRTEDWEGTELCGDLHLYAEQSIAVVAALDSDSVGRAEWIEARNALEALRVEAAEVTVPLPRTTALAHSTTMRTQSARAQRALTALLDHLNRRASSHPHEVIRSHYSCHDHVTELPFICADESDESEQEQQFFLESSGGSQACIRRSRTTVVNYRNPVRRTTNYPEGDADVEVRWIVITNVPQVGRISVRSGGDTRASALLLASLALRIVGTGTTIGASATTAGSPQVVNSRARIRLLPVRHDPVDEVTVTMDEPGRHRVHTYSSFPNLDVAFGASVSADAIIQHGQDGPFGSLTSTTQSNDPVTGEMRPPLIQWQPRGLGNPSNAEASTQVALAVTAHLFLGVRFKDWLIAAETPLASTIGNPFRGVGLRWGGVCVV